MNSEQTPPQWRADLALSLVAMIWGGTFVLVKEALTDVSPVLFLGLRFSAATIALDTWSPFASIASIASRISRAP